jgi:hypothetical protein
MKFSNNETAEIFGTASNLDGVKVVVTGLMSDDGVQFYSIERVDGKLFSTGYRALLLIESCLKPITHVTS